MTDDLNVDQPDDTKLLTDDATDTNDMPKEDVAKARRRDTHEILQDLRQQVLANNDAIPEDTIELRIEGESEPLRILVDAQLTLGRFNDRLRDVSGHLDFTPYFECGISRRHAIIRRTADGLVLIDLGSKNGTHLNNVRLDPEVPYTLSSGDQITLGDLVFSIHL